MISKTFRVILISVLLVSLSYETNVNKNYDENPMVFKGFNNSLGTFVEYSGRASIAFEDWTIYTSFNLDSLLPAIKAFEKIRTDIADICPYHKQECPKFFELFKYADTILEDGPLLMRNSTGFKFKRISLDEDGMTNTFNNTYSTIDSTKNVNVILLEHTIDPLSPKEQYGTEAPDWVAPRLLNELSLLGTQLRRSQEAILEAMHSAHQGKLSPLVLSIEQLQAEISKIYGHLPRGLSLPFDQFSISDIYRIATVILHQLDEQMVFEIKVPLIDVEQFNIYRLTPIPRVHNGSIQLLDTETPYLGINDHLDRFFPLENLDDCIELAAERIICKHNQVTYGNGDDSFACSLAAIRNQSSKVCTFRQVEKSSMWTQLVSPNSWMVALTKELSLMGVCSGASQELKINGSGILSIQSDCIVRSSVVTLQGEPKRRLPSKNGYASLQLTSKSPLKVGILESFDQLFKIVTQLKLDQEKLQAVEGYPLGIIAMCPIIVLIALLIPLAWLYRTFHRRQLSAAKNPVEGHQDTKRETITSDLPLLEKQEV
ncbi:uncharacterized protein LOC108102654 [Drosophila eugracilis]|uniref:uncharacterized protein LOC108102654 n=1 Tax=Drosophila eugracilis TaxID=29029 RepID=UPI001BDAF5F9|nr:uncharacterized protein LOC108102654 [Drosophila eugracilis]